MQTGTTFGNSTCSAACGSNPGGRQSFLPQLYVFTITSLCICFMNKLTQKTTLFFCICCLLFMSACSEDTEEVNGTARVQVRLTDAPGDYEEVNIEIMDVQVNPEDDEEGWVSLDSVNTGVYNLLQLTAGLDTLLGTAILPAGHMGQLRLILGNNNAVVENGNTHNLTTPSAQQSGLKLQINTELVAGATYQVLLDFDAAKSVVKAGNSGKYILKPVIRTIVEAQTGSIGGTLQPATTGAVIFAINGQDSVSTFASDEGRFLLRGLPAGDYNVLVQPATSSGYADKLLEGASVQNGQLTDLGAIVLEN